MLVVIVIGNTKLNIKMTIVTVNEYTITIHILILILDTVRLLVCDCVSGLEYGSTGRRRSLSWCESIVLCLEPLEEVCGTWLAEGLFPAVLHEPKPLLLIEDDLAMDVHGGAHDDALVALLPTASLLLARHRVGREAVEHRGRSGRQIGGGGGAN